MGWSESEVVCTRHPKQPPQPGICPSCLRERLSRIGGKNSTNYNFYLSSSPSQSASPVYYYRHSSASSSGKSSQHRHQRVASDIMDSIYVAIRHNSGLKKSRSMAYEPRNCGTRDQIEKKGGWLWNKLLLRSTRKNPNKLQS